MIKEQQFPENSRLDFRRSLESGLCSTFRGRSAGSFPEQRLEIEPMKIVAVYLMDQPRFEGKHVPARASHEVVCRVIHLAEKRMSGRLVPQQPKSIAFAVEQVPSNKVNKRAAFV